MRTPCRVPVLAALATGALLGPALFAQARSSMREREYVSLLGRQVFSKTDSLFRGKVSSTYEIAGGLAVGRIKVLEHLGGLDPGAEASVMAGDTEQFPATGVEILVFASRLSSQTLWKSEGHFFLEDDLGRVKIGLVRTLLDLESNGSAQERLARLRDLALRNLGDVDPWLAWNGAQEMFHIVFVHGIDLEPKERDRISDLTMRSDDDRFATYLQAILLGLRNRSPDAPRAAPVPSSGSVVEPPGGRAADGPPSLRQLAEAYLAESDPAEARGILYQLAPHPVPLVDRLLVLALSHPEEEVRAAAALLLSERGARVATAPLEAALDADRSLRVRRAAAASLGRVGGDEATRALESHLEDPAVRSDCLAALGAIASPETRRILEDALSRLPAGPCPERALIEDLLRP